MASLTFLGEKKAQNSGESRKGNRAVPGRGGETFTHRSVEPRAPCWPSSESRKLSVANICLLAAGMMLCSIPACLLDNKEIFIHLRQMKTIPSQSCLEHRHDFRFPWRRENITPIPMTQSTCYHQQMLQQIFNLFTTEKSCAAWNSTLLDRLLSSLGQRLEQLEEVTVDCPDLGIDVQKYFQGIHLYLKEKEYSSCAWEVVRVEIEKCLSLM
ncbi:interferon omega-1-like [Moschus berezovskii]|uniref:interferon omega-1-like n=1 Tax=Moschus berezovskii TaxID=68408 RepID=UPI002443DDBE|nr:interferon omega-1-like [Moschus berezovskii]